MADTWSYLPHFSHPSLETSAISGESDEEGTAEAAAGGDAGAAAGCTDCAWEGGWALLCCLLIVGIFDCRLFDVILIGT